MKNLISPLLVCHATGYVSAQSRSVTFGDHQISLDMPSDTALSLLRENYQLIRQDVTAGSAQTEWIVWNKAPMTMLGSVYIKADVVSQIDREWADANASDSAGIFDALYRREQTFEREDHTLCMLRLSRSIARKN